MPPAGYLSLTGKNVNDSGNSSEPSSATHLEIVWQLRAASIAWVHGDEGIAGGHQPDVHALKGEAAQLSSLGTLDGQDLLGHHTQHLQLNPVELVKAGPGATAC